MSETLRGAAINRRQALGLMGGAAGLALAGGMPAFAAEAIKITYPARAFVTLPFWVAQDAGLFAKYDLTSEMVFGAHPAGIATVIGGESQMTTYSPEQLVSAQLRDPAFVISSMPIQRAPFVMMGTPGVETVEQLQGKRIGIARVGDAYYYNTLAVLASVGLTEKDISWVPAGGDIAVRIQMMKNGQVDAGFVPVQHTFGMIDEGMSKIIDLATDPAFFSPIATAHRRDWAAENGDVLKRILMAEAEAIKLIYDDRDQAIAIYGAYDNLDPETVGKVYDLYTQNSYFERIPLITTAPVDYTINRVAEQTPEVRDTDLSTLFDNTHVNALIEEGFYAGLFGEVVTDELNAKVASRV